MTSEEKFYAAFAVFYVVFTIIAFVLLAFPLVEVTP